MGNKVLIVGYNFSHHDEYSGYGRLMRYAKLAKVFDYTKLFSDGDYTFIGAVLRRFLIEFLTVIKGLNVNVIHYIYPEGTIFISPLILKYVFRKKIVMTLHLAPDWFSMAYRNDSTVKRLIRKVFQGLAWRSVCSTDHGIALTSESAETYKQEYQLANVSVIPHGIVINDRPSTSKKYLQREKPSVCVVGRNYRDWEFVNSVLVDESARRYRFHLVGVDFCRVDWPADVEVLAYRERLNHEEYANVLGECLFMLLPLRYATANNAILEAYQHKVFVLTTPAGINENYLEPSLIKIDTPQHFFKIVDQLASNASSGTLDVDKILNDVKVSTSQRFGWDGIVKQFENIYQQACS